MHRHQQTFLSLAETATDRRFDMPYKKSYVYPDQFINDAHMALGASKHETGMIDYGVEGWLLPADAWKLYELAYFCGGDILEVGTYKGLSAAVMLQASNDAGLQNTIISIDLDENASGQARQTLDQRQGSERVHLFVAEGASSVAGLAAAKRYFKFAFIDHSHHYDHVAEVCRHLHRVLELGAFVLFHDFNDPRNAAGDQPDYGVYQGVLDGLNPARFEFWGIYGCCGLFRRIGPF